jgi:hypothetical protein
LSENVPGEFELYEMVSIARAKLSDVKGTAALALLCLAAAWPPASAQDSAGPAETALAALLASPAVTKALQQIKADDARTLAEQRRITEIPAPPFKERRRENTTCSVFASSVSKTRPWTVKATSPHCGRAAATVRSSSSRRIWIPSSPKIPT